MGTRLGLAGVSRTFAVATHSTALSVVGVAVVAFASGTGATSSALASSGSSTVAFAGASTASGDLSSLGRSIPDLQGGSVAASVLAVSGSSAFSARSTNWNTALSLSGVTGKRKLPTAHAASTARFWQVNETLGLSLAISDFDSRIFYLADSLGISLVPNAFYGASAFHVQGTSSVSFSSATVSSAVLAAAGSSTPALAGANVVIQSGDFSMAGSTAMALQGTVAGTVFGVGILGSAGSGAFAPTGASIAAADWAISGSSTVSLATQPIASAVFTSAGTSTVDFTQATYTVLTSSGSSSVAFTSAIIAAGNLNSTGVSSVNFVSASISPAACAAIQLELHAPTMQLEINAATILAEVA